MTARADALLELLQPSLSDADVQRIAEAVVALMPQTNQQIDPEMHRPMTQTEAAEWLGINRATLCLWTAQDDHPVPAFRMSGRPVYTKASLIEWFTSRPYREGERNSQSQDDIADDRDRGTEVPSKGRHTSRSTGKRNHQKAAATASGERFM